MSRRSLPLRGGAPSILPGSGAFSSVGRGEAAPRAARHRRQRAGRRRLVVQLLANVVNATLISSEASFIRNEPPLAGSLFWRVELPLAHPTRRPSCASGAPTAAATTKGTNRADEAPRVSVACLFACGRELGGQALCPGAKNQWPLLAAF